MKKRISCILLCIGFCYLTAQQQPSDNHSKIIAPLQELLDKGDFDNAISRADSLLKKNGRQSFDIEISLLQIIGEANLNKGEVDEANTAFDKALTVAIKNFGEQSQITAKAHQDKAMAAAAAGQADIALQEYQFALDFYKKNITKYFDDVAQVYRDMAINQFNNGDLQKSYESMQKALDIYIQYRGEQSPDAARMFSNVATVLTRMEHFGEAIKYLEKALPTYIGQFGAAGEKTAYVYNDLALAWADSGVYQKSLLYHQKALDIRKQKLPENDPNLAMSYANIGGMYEISGQSQQALPYLLQASKLLDSLEVMEITAFTAIALGEAYTKLEKPDTAISYLKNGLKRIGYEKGATIKQGEWSTMIFPNKGLELLEYLTAAYQAKNNLDSAAFFAAQTIDLSDFLQERFESSGSQAIFQKEYRHIFEMAIDINYQLFKQNKKQEYAENIFHYMEKSNSTLLNDILRTNHALNAIVPKSDLEALSALENDLVTTEENLFFLSNDEKKSEEGKRIQNQISDIKENIDETKRKLKQKYPDYALLQSEKQICDIKEIQHDLSDEQTMISYFCIDSAIYSFAINKDNFDIQKQDDIAINSQIMSFRSGIYDYYIADAPSNSLSYYDSLYQTNAFSLYQELIFPFESVLKKRLVIVPGGVLALVPFEALLKKKPAISKELRYLLHDYAVSYSFSATLFSNYDDDDVAHGSKKFLGLAPSFSSGPIVQNNPNSQGYGNLLFNKAEVQSIAKMVDGDQFLGKEATKKQFLTQATDYRILHLATHGILNDQNSDFSYLAFSNNQDATDDKLYIKDLYHQKLNASLAVLSACETGVGSLQEGEGIISLARGFAYAGVKSIITSLWKVNDSKTQKLMQLFYKEIEQDIPQDIALQQAKLAYLKEFGNQKDFANPFYWAAFVQTGDTLSLLRDDKSRWYIWLLLGIGITAFIFWFFRYRKKTK